MKNTNIFDFGVEDTHFNYLPTFPNTKRIKLFEAFAGIGCQAMALKRLGIDFESVGISEIDKYAIMSYNAIHGETKNYGDICKMETIPECDIFTWSFPCTDLSKAGKQNGLDGTRSGLVYEVIRLLENTKKKPQVLIMENVVDLVQVKFASAFYEIQKTIESLGYTNYTRTLNAKDYGVAQNRERVFMVSILGNYRYEFPLSMPLELRLKDYLEESVDEKYYLTAQQLSKLSSNEYESQGIDRGKNIEDETINAITTMQGGGREPKIAYALRSKEFKTRGFMETCPTLCARDYKDPKVIKTVIDTKSSEKFARKSSSEIMPSILTDTRFSIVEPICLNSKVNGKQPSLQDRVYDTNGTSTVITTSFMPSIAIPEATIKGYALAEDGDGVYLNRPHQKRGVVQKGMIQTLKTSGDDVGVVELYNGEELKLTFFEHIYRIETKLDGEKDYQEYISFYYETGDIIVQDQNGKAYILNKEGLLFRIRKTIPKETWRLMGIDDEDFYKAQAVVSNSQLYKQAGNGICVPVFQGILEGLFEKETK